MELLLWALIDFLDDRNDSRATTKTLQTESCQNRATVQAPRT